MLYAELGHCDAIGLAHHVPPPLGCFLFPCLLRFVITQQDVVFFSHGSIFRSTNIYGVTVRGCNPWAVSVRHSRLAYTDFFTIVVTIRIAASG